MKILDVKITADNKMVITTDEPIVNLVRIYVDSLYNRSNLYSEVVNDHTYYTRNFTVDNSSKVITINISEWNLDRSSFIVSLELIFDGVTRNTRKFVFDDEELYYGEVSLLTSFCNTCLDKQLKERIVLLSVKEQLLLYAVKHELLEDSVDLYIDLTRLLGIDIKNNCFYKGVLVADVDKYNVADSEAARLRYNKHSLYYLNTNCNCSNGTCTIS